MATPLCYTVIIPFFIALFLVGWIHPKLVKIALLKNIVDNPDARKLQRTPVPVLGGVAVFFGVVIAIGCMSAVVDCSGLPVVIMAMMAMLYTGTMDDILSLSPGLRFVIEIVVDQQGRVTSAAYRAKGSTTQNSVLVNAALRAARGARFNVDESAPLSQTGTITYNFRMQ